MGDNDTGERMAARHWRRIQLALTIAWILLIAPSLIWWAQSIRWLVLMSVWANVAASAAAWMAAKGDENSVGKEDLEPIYAALHSLSPEVRDTDM